MNIHTTNLLSIVVPVYNGEQYIRMCIDSLFAQIVTHPFEIVVIDDGSTDSTPAILQEYTEKYNNAYYEDSQVRDFKIIRQENRGAMYARMRGIRDSHGEYLGFVDGDDWVHREMFESLLKPALSESADIVSCGFINVDKDGTILKYQEIPNIHEDNCDERVFSHNFFSFCNSIFRRTLFEKIDSFTDVHRGDDLVVVLCLFYYASHVIRLRECYYHYRNISDTPKIHKGIAVNLLKDLEGMEDLFQVGDVLAEFFKDKNILASALIPYTIKFPDLFNRYNYHHVRKYFHMHNMWNWYFTKLLSLLLKYPKYYLIQNWYGKRENKVPLDCFKRVFEPSGEDPIQNMRQLLDNPSLLSRRVLMFRKMVRRKLFLELFPRIAYKIIRIAKHLMRFPFSSRHKE